MGMILTRIVWLEQVQTCIVVGQSISCIVGSGIVAVGVSKCPASNFIHRVRIPLVVIIDGVIFPKVDRVNTSHWHLLHKNSQSIVSVALRDGLVQIVTVPILAKNWCADRAWESWALGMTLKPELWALYPLRQNFIEAEFSVPRHEVESQI